MQGPLGKQRALLALRAPALRWLDAYKAAMAGWTERIEDDVVIATMYGQLSSQVGDLPVRA